MSLQAAGDDEICTFEDCSLIYVKDRRGVFRSPLGYERTRSNDALKLKECDRVYGASCVVEQCGKEGKSLQSPCCLYKICRNFVAKNLHLLDSLQNFPETIGHELFLETLKLQTFHKNSDYLKIFCDAYNGLVLKHLCLRQATLLINEYLRYFQCFNSLTTLDLSHCRLGDKHEYFISIGKMKSLECLHLKDNCLSDIGLTAWSLPHRMLNNGPKYLRILDLSSNPSLTDSCLKSLLKFFHLKSLNLSGTAVTFTPGVLRLKKLMNFDSVSYIKEFSDDARTVTKGWATSFISELSSKLKGRKTTEWKNTGNFYKRLGPGTSALGVSSKINTNIHPVILLQSVKQDFFVTCNILKDQHVKCRPKKRLVTDDKIVTFKRRKVSDTHVKREILGEISKENLLDSYLSYL